MVLHLLTAIGNRKDEDDNANNNRLRIDLRRLLHDLNNQRRETRMQVYENISLWCRAYDGDKRRAGSKPRDDAVDPSSSSENELDTVDMDDDDDDEDALPLLHKEQISLEEAIERLRRLDGELRKGCKRDRARVEDLQEGLRR